MSRLGALNVLIIEFSFHEEHFIFRITASLSIFITFSASKQPAGTGRPLGPFYFFFFSTPICKSSRVPSVANVLMPWAYRTVPRIPAPTIIASSLAFCGLDPRPRVKHGFFYVCLQLFNPHQQSNTSSYTVGNYLQILFRNNIFIFSISLRYIN